MAFTVTTMTYSLRKKKLGLLQNYLNELVQINEDAEKLRKQLLVEEQTQTEIGNTVNKVLAAGGPPFVSAATDLAACTGDTISDRMVNILSSLAGIGWSYSQE